MCIIVRVHTTSDWQHGALYNVDYINLSAISRHVEQIFSSNLNSSVTVGHQEPLSITVKMGGKIKTVKRKNRIQKQDTCQNEHCLYAFEELKHYKQLQTALLGPDVRDGRRWDILYYICNTYALEFVERTFYKYYM